MHAADVMHIWLLIKPYYCKRSPILHLHNFTYIVGLDELLLYTIYIGQLIYRMDGNFGGELILADWRF